MYDVPDFEQQLPDKVRVGYAREAARQILKTTGIKGCPILISDIAAKLPTLEIHGREMPDGFSGMQAAYKGIVFIQYNSSHSHKRNRFTVAHELGHAVLSHTQDCSRDGFGSSRNIEVEANQFAAELLMPLALIKKHASEAKTVTGLAKMFWVSEDAMQWRVVETKTFNRLSSWD